MSRLDRNFERPSRWSRVVLIMSALAVVVLAVWVLTPIVLANLTAPTGASNAGFNATFNAASNAAANAAANAALPQPRDVVAGGKSGVMGGRREARDLVIPAAPDDAANVADAAVSVAAKDDPAPPPAAPAFAAASSPSSYGLSTPPSTAAIASTIPWPVPAAEPQSAADAEPEASSPPSDFGRVPLPRRRPNPALAAHLGIPLPRPRPDAAVADVPPPDQSGMDALIDRMSKIE